jgi:hypothetical protein
MKRARNHWTPPYLVKELYDQDPLLPRSSRETSICLFLMSWVDDVCVCVRPAVPDD